LSLPDIHSTIIEPKIVFKEMKRVCKKHGTIMVVDGLFILKKEKLMIILKNSEILHIPTLAL
jgi:ubiquinone/menaquinone biosynthesis C-methylase UbiE